MGTIERDIKRTFVAETSFVSPITIFSANPDSLLGDEGKIGASTVEHRQKMKVYLHPGDRNIVGVTSKAQYR